MEASRLIDKKYWSQFIQADYKDSVDESVQNQKAKIKHDGQKFEDLVEDLLNLEYGNITWERTKTTHDGNKDFRGFSAEKKVWAISQSVSARNISRICARISPKMKKRASSSWTKTAESLSRRELFRRNWKII